MIPDEPTPIDLTLVNEILAAEKARSDGEATAEVPGEYAAVLDLLEAAWPRAGAPSEPAGAPAAPVQPPRWLGRFEILGELGRGGFGLVLKANDTKLGRKVALKLPNPELILSRSIRRRFLHEARAAAGLDHDAIVRVFEACDDGEIVYIASAYVDGPNLSQWLRRRAELAPVAAECVARLGVILAGGIEHAHRAGIYHRDLKPSNIVLKGPAEAASLDAFLPFITDFGLAAITHPEPGRDEASDEEATRSNHMLVGSPPYMAPEVIRDRGLKPGPGIDVYGLGTILYEVITGRPPFRGETPEETLELVVSEEPVRPRTLRPGLPPELETIVLTCLRKDPALRYGSARELAEDLGRFLNRSPILARPDSPWRRLRHWSRRNPRTAAAVVGFLAMGPIVLGGVLLRNAWLEASLRQIGQMNERLMAQDGRHRDMIVALELRHAQEILESGGEERAQEILRDLPPEVAAHDGTRFARDLLWRRARRSIAQLQVHEAEVEALAHHPGRGLLASGDAEGRIRVGTDRGDVEPLTLAGHGGAICGLAFDADAERLASAAEIPDGSGRCEVRLWSCTKGTPEPGSWIMPGRVASLAWVGTDRVAAMVEGPDGGPLATLRVLAVDGRCEPIVRPVGAGCVIGGARPGVVVWTASGGLARLDPRTLEPVWSRGEGGGPPDGLAIDPNGRYLAVRRGSRLAVAAWRDGSAVRELEVLPGRGPCAAFSPDGRRVAVVEPGGKVRIRGLDGSADPAVALDGFVVTEIHRLDALAWSPDSRRVAACAMGETGLASTLAIWEADTGRLVAPYPGRRIVTPVLSFSGDGGALVFMSDRTVDRWTPDPGAGGETCVRLDAHQDEAWALAFSRDGRRFATGADDAEGVPAAIRIWESATRELIAELPGPAGTVTDLAFHPGGAAEIATVSLDGSGEVLLWDLQRNRVRLRLRGPACNRRAVAYSPDGRLVAAAGDDRLIQLWDARTGSHVRTLRGHANKVRGLAFPAAGPLRLVSVSNDESVRLWDVATGQAVWTRADGEPLGAVAFSPDGRLIAAGDESGVLLILRADDGRVLDHIYGDDGALLCLAFTPDGSALAAAGRSRRVRLWDPANGQELLALGPLGPQANHLAFSPDGSTLAATVHDGGVLLWGAGGASRSSPASAPARRGASGGLRSSGPKLYADTILRSR